MSALNLTHVQDQVRAAEMRLERANDILFEIRDLVAASIVDSDRVREETRAEVAAQYDAEITRLRNRILELQGYDPETLEKIP